MGTSSGFLGLGIGLRFKLNFGFLGSGLAIGFFLSSKFGLFFEGGKTVGELELGK